MAEVGKRIVRPECFTGKQRVVSTAAGGNVLREEFD
jgi:hypothetical protein